MTDRPWWYSPEGEQPDLGSAAQEAAALFGALRDRLFSDPATMRAGSKLLQAFGGLSTAANPVPPGEAPECAYCPVCQAIARAQSMSPEAVERLAGAAMEFAETVRQVVASPPAEEGLRHVHLDEDFEGWPEPEEPAADDLATDDPAGHDPAGHDPAGEHPDSDGGEIPDEQENRPTDQ